MLDKTTPKNRNEHEIAGYRDVLKTIHENYEYIPKRVEEYIKNKLGKTTKTEIL